jgi:hypothetical protein
VRLEPGHQLAPAGPRRDHPRDDGQRVLGAVGGASHALDERRANRLQPLGRLLAEERGGPDTRVELRIEEQLRGRDAPQDSDGLRAERAEVEAGFAESTAALFGVGEAEEERSLRELDRNRMLRYGRVDDLRRRVALRHPRREGEAAARREDAMGLGERRLGLCEMKDAEVHGDGVERRVRKGQRLGVALDEPRAGTAQARTLEHRGSHVEPHGIGAARGGRLRDVAGAAGDVEHPGSSADPCRVEQRLDVERRVGPALLVVRGGPLPACALELPELAGRRHLRSLAGQAACP